MFKKLSIKENCQMNSIFIMLLILSFIFIVAVCSVIFPVMIIAVNIGINKFY